MKVLKKATAVIIKYGFMRRILNNILAKVRAAVLSEPLIVGLFFITLFLRLFNLSEHAMFLGDQGRDALIVRDILLLKHFPAIGAPTSIGQVYLGPFYYYLVAPFLLLTRFNPVGMAIGVALMSSIGIIFAYYLIKQELGQKTATVSLFLMTFSAVNVEYSRFSWNPNLLPIMTLFTLYFFYKMLSEKKYGYAAVFGAFFALSLQLHYLVILITPAMALYLLYWLNLNRRQTFVTVKKIALSLLFFCFFSSPLLIFDLRHDFLNTRNFLNMFANSPISGSGGYGARFLETSGHFFYQVFIPTNWQSYPFLMVLLAFVPPLVLFTVLKLQKVKFKGFAILLLLSVCSYLLGFALLNSPRNPHYYGPASFIFLTSLAYLFVTKAKNCKMCHFFILVLLGLYFAVNIGGIYKQVFIKGNGQIEHSRRVAIFLLKQNEGKPYNIATWPVEFTEDNYVYFLNLYNSPPQD
jgi:4-amino-4-deoxy-L-arabinose transferase-like glycosyltransferase